MKRILTTAAVLGALGLAPAGASWADPQIGCGPGTQIWQGNAGLAPHVLGATTNNTLGLQTFGITFGTIGCEQGGGTVTADAQTRAFAAANLDQLARDMARGDGESLGALALLMGVAPQDRPAFFALTKSRFADIFTGETVTERDVLDALATLMANDAVLAAYVES